MPYTKKEEGPRGRPVDEVRFGSRKVVVWQNETKSGPVLNFTIARLYREGDSWKESQSLGTADLLPMTESLREAYRRAASPKEPTDS